MTFREHRLLNEAKRTAIKAGYKVIKEEIDSVTIAEAIEVAEKAGYKVIHEDIKKSNR